MTTSENKGLEVGYADTATRDTGEGLARSSSLLAVGTLTSRVTGLAKIMVASWVLGATTSRLADVYNLANTAPNQFYELALGGILTSVLVPLIVAELATKVRRTAWQSVANLFWVSISAAAIASVVLAVVAPWIIGFATRGYTASQTQLATNLLRLFAAQVFFYALNALAGAVLNSRRHFGVPAFVPALNNIFVIAVLILFGLSITAGPSTDLSTQMLLLLGLGTTGGVAVMALANLPKLRSVVRTSGGSLAPRFSTNDPLIRRLVRLSAWTAMYVITNQVGLYVVQVLANGPGSHAGDYTAWTYAFMFFQLPNGVFAVSVLTALLPSLAERLTQNDFAGFRKRLADGVRLTAFLILPASVGYLLLAPAIIRIFLQYGNFTADATLRTAQILQLFSLGLIPFTLFMLVLRSFYAMQNTRTPFLINAISTAVTISFDILVYPHLRIWGLSLGYVLNYVIAASLGWWLLRRKIGPMAKAGLSRSLGRITLACVPLTLVVGAIVWLTPDGSSGAWPLAEVIGGTVVGGATYIATTRVLHVEELRRLTGALRKRHDQDGNRQEHR